MNKLLSEILKVDGAISGISTAPAAIAISRAYPLGPKQRKALFILDISSTTMIRDDVLDIGIVDDSVVTPAASAALGILEAAGDALKFAHVTAGVKVTAMAVDVTAAADGAITINGTVFTYAAVPATALEWSDDATLVVAINGAGLGLTAAAPGANIVTIISTITGDKTITLTSTVTLVIDADVVTTRAQAYLEVDASEMDLAAGAENVYFVVDNPVANAGTVMVSAILVRGDSRYTPEQAVATS